MSTLEEAMEDIHKGMIKIIQVKNTFDDCSPEAERLSDILHDLDGSLDFIDEINTEMITRKVQQVVDDARKRAYEAV